MSPLILPSIGLITALPHEYIAMKSLLDNAREVYVPGRGTGRRYVIGEIPAINGNRHSIALSLLVDMGNNSAAIRANRLLDVFPTIQTIITVGIAGGVPSPSSPNQHVRLGDIVVSDYGGVVQYDFDKETSDIIEHRHRPRPPDAVFLEGIRLLQAEELTGSRPWLLFIEQACSQLQIERPSEDTDRLADTIDPHQVMPHPHDTQRIIGQPRVFTGPIAAANKLLKNPMKRDTLRDRFNIKAIEMESSGIADATWDQAVGYITIRGICDYCDKNKGDAWQRYAAIAAAAYARALLESLPTHEPAANLRSSLLIEQWPEQTDMRGNTSSSDLFFSATYHTIDDAQRFLDNAYQIFDTSDIRPTDCDDAVREVQTAQQYLQRLWTTLNETNPLPSTFVNLYNTVKLRRFPTDQRLKDLVTRITRFRSTCRPATPQVEVQQQTLQQTCAELRDDFRDLNQFLPQISIGLSQPQSEQHITVRSSMKSPITPEPPISKMHNKHIDWSRMTDDNLDRFTDLLLACTSVQDRGSRDAIVGRLGSDIAHNIKRHETDRVDVSAIITTCQRYDGGLDRLLARVHNLERGSIAIRNIQIFLQPFELIS